jgi:hypothetical protein
MSRRRRPISPAAVSATAIAGSHANGVTVNSAPGDRQGHGQVGIGQALAAADPIEQVDDLRVVAGETADGVRGTAEGGPEHREADHPAEQHAAVQSPGERERAGQRGGSVGRAEAGRQLAGTEVAALDQRVRRAGQHRGEAGGRREDPPLFAGVRA